MQIPFLFALVLIFSSSASAEKAVAKDSLKMKLAPKADSTIIFDLPIAYNSRVQFWVRYYQTNGREHFTKWLERSNRHMPNIQKILVREGLPKDLGYVAMIESGFSSRAISSASAVGPWQFIGETGKRYGLKQSWWLDERRDFDKSTKAAAAYFKFLYNKFGSWYLAAAGYNAGENRIKRLTIKHGTKNFWSIAQKGGFADETQNYVPKLIAAMLIAKAPSLYGFRNLNPEKQLDTEHFFVPGGTDLNSVADAIGMDRTELRDLNPELLQGRVPETVSGHRIRIPKGTSRHVSHFVQSNWVSTTN